MSLLAGDFELLQAYRKDTDEQAITALEKFSRERTDIGNEVLVLDEVDEWVLDVSLRSDRADRACQFFTDLVLLRDRILPDTHPNRAFTRVLLARALIHEQADLARAEVVLQEAQEILAKQPMVPKRPRQEIALLLDQIDQIDDTSDQQSK